MYGAGRDIAVTPPSCGLGFMMLDSLWSEGWRRGNSAVGPDTPAQGPLWIAGNTPCPQQGLECGWFLPVLPPGWATNHPQGREKELSSYLAGHTLPVCHVRNDNGKPHQSWNSHQLSFPLSGYVTWGLGVGDVGQ